MALTKLDFNTAGFNQLRNLPSVQARLAEAGRAVAEAAGDGFDYEVKQGPQRARVRIYPTDRASRKATADHALERALGAAR